ncbi:hypothetical protein DFH06DRAFT_1128054 [Mycena polygramma]|nr:hypothetical protein DFH06DRAFT_1128054 [Mycena polygramma]
MAARARVWARATRRGVGSLGVGEGTAVCFSPSLFPNNVSRPEDPRRDRAPHRARVPHRCRLRALGGYFLVRNVYPILASAEAKPTRLIIVVTGLHAGWDDESTPPCCWGTTHLCRRCCRGCYFCRQAHATTPLVRRVDEQRACAFASRKSIASRILHEARCERAGRRAYWAVKKPYEARPLSCPSPFPFFFFSILPVYLPSSPLLRTLHAAASGTAESAEGATQRRAADLWVPSTSSARETDSGSGAKCTIRCRLRLATPIYDTVAAAESDTCIKRPAQYLPPAARALTRTIASRIQHKARGRQRRAGMSHATSRVLRLSVWCRDGWPHLKQHAESGYDGVFTRAGNCAPLSLAANSAALSSARHGLRSQERRYTRPGSYVNVVLCTCELGIQVEGGALKRAGVELRLNSGTELFKVRHVINPEIQRVKELRLRFTALESEADFELRENLKLEWVPESDFGFETL